MKVGTVKNCLENFRTSLPVSDTS